MYKPHTITQKDADNLRKAITAISSGFSWSQTEEGHDFWSEVVESLTRKAHHRTSDGYPQTPEDAPREIVYVDGIAYEIPDGRDIGKLALASSQSTANACLSQVCIRIADYRPDDERPYVSATGSNWKYAVLIPEEDGNGNG